MKRWVNEYEGENNSPPSRKRGTQMKAKRKSACFSILSKNQNCIRSMKFGKYVLKDSLDHMPASLESLTCDLRNTGHPFQIIEEAMVIDKYLSSPPNKSDPLYTNKVMRRKERKDLLLQKSFYPYEWTTSISKLKKTKTLPEKSDFFSKLKNDGISDEDHNFAKMVFKKFKCKNMLDYCLLYVKIDTLLLCEVFQAYRKNIFGNFGIDSAHFSGVPALAQAMYRTQQDREDPVRLMTDPDMINLIINNVRGGLAIVNKRYSKSDPPSAFDRSDPKNIQPTPGKKSIVMGDYNALYPSSQQFPLPYKFFSYLGEEYFDHFEKIVMAYTRKSNMGFIAMVDLEYPPSLHDLHDTYPVATENVDITYDMLSPYSQRQLKSKMYNQRKLIAPLSNRKNYVCHVANLQLYLKLGLKLTKIHKVIKFKQKPWLKRFVTKCTKLRSLAKSKFYEDNWKLTQNSAYGKLLENCHLYRETQLVDTCEAFEKKIANSRFDNTTYISDNIVAVHRKPKKLRFNKNYAAGFTVLEISKFLMFSMLYEKILPIVPEFKVLYSDTDSFIAEVPYHPTDFFEKIKHLCDFSKYPPDHKLFSLENKHSLNFMKDETHGKHYISEFIGLRAKCYALKLKSFDKGSEAEKLRCKGINRTTVKNHMKFAEYYTSLFKNKIFRKNNVSIKRKKFKLSTTVQRKIALSPFDSKRFIFNCGVHSYSFGHYKCKDIVQNNGKCPECQ